MFVDCMGCFRTSAHSYRTLRSWLLLHRSCLEGMAPVFGNRGMMPLYVGCCMS